MQERRLKRETDFEQRQMEKEKERVETARAKEKEREERLAAARAQQRSHIEDLQKKIQQKVCVSVDYSSKIRKVEMYRFPASYPGLRVLGDLCLNATQRLALVVGPFLVF